MTWDLVTWSFEWVVLPVISENNMQYRILNDCFITQVIPEAFLNVQLVVPMSDHRENQAKQRHNYNAISLQNAR